MIQLKYKNYQAGSKRKQNKYNFLTGDPSKL